MNFYRLWEAIQHQEDSILGVLTKFSKEDCVKFALYCAEDVLHLNDQEILPLAQRCIDLIKKWLNDPKSVTANELRNAGDAVGHAVYNNNDPPSEAAASVWHAIHTIQPISDTIQAASSAMRSAVRASGSHTNKYINLARSFLSKTTSTNPLHKTFLQNPDISSIMAFLDHAEEVDENIVLHQNGQFIFNMPGHMIRAKDKGELAEKILNDKEAIYYLKRLYNI